MAKYLLVSPDRYARFGHQTSSISTSLLLAYMTGSRVILPRYMYSCDKWNQYVNFSRSKFVCAEVTGSHLSAVYLENWKTDNIGNRKWVFDNTQNVQQLLTQIANTDDNSIIFLPFDQTPGILHRLYNQTRLREDIRGVFRFDNSIVSMDNPYVAIHIRRGDVNEESHPSWYVNNSFYIELIERLCTILPNSFGIYICIQGDKSWLQRIRLTQLGLGRKFMVSSACAGFANDYEVADFLTMKESTILFSASSGFSHWASIIGNQKLVVDVSRYNDTPLDWVKHLNPDSPTESVWKTISSLADRYN